MSEPAATITAPAPAATAATVAETLGSGLGGANPPAPKTDAPPATPNTAPHAGNQPWSWTKEDGAFNDGWRDRLPDDLKGVKDLEKYKDLTGVLRSNVHLQKMIGADKLPLPPKNATPEEWAKWDGWNKLGRPETPDKYDLKALKALPEGIPYSYEGEKAMVAEMHKLGMTQTQVAGLLERYRANVGGEFGQMTQKQQADALEMSKAIRQEYGAAFEKKMFQAEDYARRELGEGADSFLQKHKLDADVIRLLVKASEANREDRRVDGKSSGLDSALSPAEAKQELSELMSAAKDPKHPLNNKTDPLYAQLNARRLKLHEYINPGE